MWTSVPRVMAGCLPPTPNTAYVYVDVCVVLCTLVGSSLLKKRGIYGTSSLCPSFLPNTDYQVYCKGQVLVSLIRGFGTYVRNFQSRTHRSTQKGHLSQGSTYCWAFHVRVPWQESIAGPPINTEFGSKLGCNHCKSLGRQGAAACSFSCPHVPTHNYGLPPPITD